MGAITMIAFIVKGKEASWASVLLILTITAGMDMSGSKLNLEDIKINKERRDRKIACQKICELIFESPVVVGKNL